LPSAELKALTGHGGWQAGAGRVGNVEASWACRDFGEARRPACVTHATRCVTRRRPMHVRWPCRCRARRRIEVRVGLVVSAGVRARRRARSRVKPRSARRLWPSSSSGSVSGEPLRCRHGYLGGMESS
jgi:hypothetical protein